MHHYLFRVYIEDTDAMGIVNHAKYLCFFERARSEMLREKGWALSSLAKNNIHFAINRAELHYLSPAYLDDMITIETVIINQSACSLSFEQLMRNEHNVAICQCVIKMVCVNEDKKPRRLPEFLTGPKNNRTEK